MQTPYNETIPSYIKNMSDFVEKLNKTIEEDEVMVSFDIQSLFTSVPRDQAAIAVEEALRNDEYLREPRASKKNRS